MTNSLRSLSAHTFESTGASWNTRCPTHPRCWCPWRVFLLLASCPLSMWPRRVLMERTISSAVWCLVRQRILFKSLRQKGSDDGLRRCWQPKAPRNGSRALAAVGDVVSLVGDDPKAPMNNTHALLQILILECRRVRCDLTLKCSNVISRCLDFLVLRRNMRRQCLNVDVRLRHSPPSERCLLVAVCDELDESHWFHLSRTIAIHKPQHCYYFR